jgi:hypothetical protein
MKKGTTYLVLILLVFTGSLLAAQEEASPTARPAQVTFAYPLGTNGIDALDYPNYLSLNILFGLNGGVRGAEFGGVFNFNKGDVQWAQWAGVFNINTGDARGVQVAGVFNLNFKDFTGFQMGVVNYSQKLTGVQLGVVNITRNADRGVPVGLVNIVKGGHYELEMTGGDVIYANINCKMGVEKFYSIIKAGITSFDDSPVYAAGFGFGGTIRISERHKLSIDASTSSIVYNNSLPIAKRNVLNKLDLTYRFEFLPNLSMLIGPSANIYITEQVVDGSYNTLNVPYTLYSRESAGTNTSFWIGANAGLSYRL